MGVNGATTAEMFRQPICASERRFIIGRVDGGDKENVVAAIKGRWWNG